MCSILDTENKEINKILDLSKELNSRKKKLKELRIQGFSFPNNFHRDYTLHQLNILYGKKSNRELKEMHIEVKVAGRVIFLRHMGKISFVVLQDAEERIQLYVSSEKISKVKYNKEFKKVDLGDIVGAKGIIFKTKTEELSIRCTDFIFLTKSIRPFPSKFYGLNNPNIRYRKRYLDLIFNDNSYLTFRLRSRIILEIRKFMQENDFIEVETPILQPKPGGAIARSFVTHHFTFDKKMYLRIAPELYLKRLIIGRFEKIFEISKNFRNEGISVNHSPEFTMLELYIAYADYRDLILILEKLIRVLTERIFGKHVIEYLGKKIDLSRDFIKMTMKESICFIHKINRSSLEKKSDLLKISKFLNVPISEDWSVGRIQTEIFEKTVESKLIQPTFITSYPVEVSPLARRNDKNPSLTDRFEFFISGIEIGNGFSELNDFEDQKNRFKEQIKFKSLNKGNVENNNIFYDKEYITALEYGLPPTAGLGIGIDRLVMILTNSKNIRDVILFPNLYSDIDK